MIFTPTVRGKFWLLVALVPPLALHAFAQSGSTQSVTLALTGETSKARIPEEFSGLSFEMQRVLPAANGTHFFRADNRALLTLFRTLGIRSLRVGGNTADRPTVPIPAPADIDALFAFARAAKVKVIFTLRLRGGDPRQAAELAKYVSNRYANLLSCLSLGNEPSVFAADYASFRETWLRFADLINAPGYAPHVRFGGPAATAGTSAWTRDFAREFGPGGRLLLATQHIYPGGNADLVKDPAVGRDLVLSRAWVEGYQKFHDSFVPGVRAAGIPYRLEETNSFWNGGRQDVSDTFAAALWALDYQNWWATRGAAGLNFHTGDFVAKREVNTRCMYAAFWTVTTGLEAKPLAYALKAFDLTRHGRVLRVTLSGTDLNLTAYAVQAVDARYLTIINKEHGPAALAASIALQLTPGTVVEQIALTAPDADVARKDGITLGGGTITNQGEWNGVWQKTSSPRPDGNLLVRVPAASALIFKITPS